MFFKFFSLLVQVEERLRLMRWEWAGPIVKTEFQAAFEQLVTCSAAHQVTHWLADVSLIPPVGTDEQAWLSEVWLPQFASISVQSIALIQPTSLHNQLVVENVLTDGCRHLRAEVQFFSDIPAALDWLTPTDSLAQQLELQWAQLTTAQPPPASSLISVGK